MRNRCRIRQLPSSGIRVPEESLRRVHALACLALEHRDHAEIDDDDQTECDRRAVSFVAEVLEVMT